MKDYQFGYDVHGYDEYGNPNVHSRTEQRDGYNVKGNVSENLETQSICMNGYSWLRCVFKLLNDFPTVSAVAHSICSDDSKI